MSLAPGGAFTAGLSLRTVHTRANCWDIVRADGTTYRLTDHDRQLTFNGNTYTPANALGKTAQRRQGGLDESSEEYLGIIDSSVITSSDIRAGYYRNATITRYVVDWRFPFFGAYETAVYFIRSITWDGERWNANVEGLASKLRTVTGDVYSRPCMLDLGRGICGLGVTLATFTITDVEVAAVTDRSNFDAIDGDITSQSDDYYNDALITWKTGNNANLTSHVKDYTDTGRVFELWLPTPNTIQAGDTFDLQRGCDKTLATCRDTFSNVVNHRGEPYPPGTDKTLRTEA